jgi:hypothetical protein
MSKRETNKELIVSVQATLPELTPAELRLVVGGIPGVRGTGGGGGYGY